MGKTMLPCILPAGSLEVRCIAKRMPGTETVFRKISIAPAAALEPRARLPERTLPRPNAARRRTEK